MTSFLHQIEVLVLTWNEEANLQRTLDALGKFPKVVVLDSGSTDKTTEIAARYPNVRIHSRPFDNHASQWNHGLTSCGIEAPWVLALDADYVLSDDLIDEIARLRPAETLNAYRATFRYCIAGEPLTGSLYPPLKILFRRARASYIQDGHTQRVVVDGAVVDLASHVLHDDRKSLSAWLCAQDRYSRLECELLLSRPWRRLSWRDRLRRLVVITPWLVPLVYLVARRGLLDGRRGMFYAIQRAVAEALLSLRLVESQLFRKSGK